MIAVKNEFNPPPVNQKDAAVLKFMVEDRIVLDPGSGNNLCTL